MVQTGARTAGVYRQSDAAGVRKQERGPMLPFSSHTHTHSQKERERAFPNTTPHIHMDKHPGDCGDLPSLWDQNLTQPLKEGLHGVYWHSREPEPHTLNTRKEFKWNHFKNKE